LGKVCIHQAIVGGRGARGALFFFTFNDYLQKSRVEPVDRKTERYREGSDAPYFHIGKDCAFGLCCDLAFGKKQPALGSRSFPAARNAATTVILIGVDAEVGSVIVASERPPPPLRGSPPPFAAANGGGKD
jgi:hypothetical protein